MGRLMFFSRVKPKTVLKMNFNTTTFCLAFALFWFTSLWTCGRSVPLQGNSLGILAPGYTSGNLGWISPFGNPPANPSVPAYPVNGGGLYGYPSTAMDNANYRYLRRWKVVASFFRPPNAASDKQFLREKWGFQIWSRRLCHSGFSIWRFCPTIQY